MIALATGKGRLLNLMKKIRIHKDNWALTVKIKDKQPLRCLSE
jgi:hypothetical protein